MGRSRRAITTPAFRFFQLCCGISLFLGVFLGLAWFRAHLMIAHHGNRLLTERMSTVFNTPVSLTTAALHFPNHLSISQLSLRDGDSSTPPFLSIPQLEVDLSFTGLLQGRIRLKNVTLVTPSLTVVSSNASFFRDFITSMVSRKTIPAVSRGTLFTRLSPSTWPVYIDPAHFEVLQGDVHLEDERELLPNLEGRFDFAASRVAGQLLPLTGRLEINSGQLFYHGLQTSFNGSMTIDSSEIQAAFRLHPEKETDLDLKIRAKPSKNQTEVTFELDCKEYDLKNFALFRYPLIPLSPTTNVSGALSSDSPILYGKRFDSFSAQLLHTQSGWRLDAVSLKLPEGKGLLTGAITPGKSSDTNATTLRFAYNGTAFPDLRFTDQTADLFAPFLWKAPYSFDIVLIGDQNIYPFQAHTLKLTGSHGDYFAGGSFDLFSGYSQLNGTYLVPVSQRKNGTQGLKQSETISLQLSGPLSLLQLQMSPTQSSAQP